MVRWTVKCECHTIVSEQLAHKLESTHSSLPEVMAHGTFNDQLVSKGAR